MQTPTAVERPSSAPLGPEWNRLIERCNAPSMIVAIRSMMSRRLLQRYEPEDLWQETLLQAWSSWPSFEYRGDRSFRRWLLEIARRRICDVADREGAEKRGQAIEFSALEKRIGSDSRDGDYAGPICTTSPGRAEADREIAMLLQRALESVPEECREIVAYHLFQDQSFEEIAARLGSELSVEGIRYRFRKGFEIYARELRRLRHLGPDGLFPG
ncbi:MAG: sigma-70 family RNA polymerase sigma factor [Planctomycetes bacterium]|nr:sigma-70 family RNA polymerase sigma factor [Planctomycetota bacterium]